MTQLLPQLFQWEKASQMAQRDQEKSLFTSAALSVKPPPARLSACWPLWYAHAETSAWAAALFHLRVEKETSSLHINIFSNRFSYSYIGITRTIEKKIWSVIFFLTHIWHSAYLHSFCYWHLTYRKPLLASRAGADTDAAQVVIVACQGLGIMGLVGLNQDRADHGVGRVSSAWPLLACIHGAGAGQPPYPKRGAYFWVHWHHRKIIFFLRELSLTE